MLRMIWRSLIVSICLVSFGLPLLTSAESVTPAALRAVTTFAASKDFCKVKKDARTADCEKQMTLCDANQWASYVNSNVTFVGNTPQQNSGADVPSEVLSFLRMDAAYRSAIPPLNEAACYCECPQDSTSLACEGKPAGTPFRVGSDLQTREECIGLCSQARSEIAAKCAGSLPSLAQADTSSVEGRQAIDIALQSADAQIMCFTQEECLDKKGTLESYSSCPNGKGRCYAPPPTVKLNTQIGSVKEIQGFGNYIIIIFRYLLSIVVFVTTIMFTWGAFRYFIGSTGSGTSAGKARMKDAIIGMILLICSVGIMRTINPETLKMNRIKVYMVNTQQYVQSQFCKDLSASTKLADAGIPPSLRDRSVVEKSLTAYSVAPKTAECGHEYYIKDSTSNSTCEGLSCPNEEVCVSCVTGEPEGCQNQKSKKKVCDKAIFAGSVRYQDGRYPMNAYLIGVCGYAQINNLYNDDALDLIDKQLIEVADVSFDKIAGKSGVSTADVDTAGDAGYRFQFDSAAIQKAITACSGAGNSLRGFLLAIKYQDKGVALNDFALLSKQNCVGSGKTVYDGYASGGVTNNEIASAFLCGLRKTPSPKFLSGTEIYWTVEEMEAAVAGRHPQSCNFNLTASSAPEDPGEKDPYCPISAARQQAVASAPACASNVKNGLDCDNTVRTCRLGTNVLCSCTADTQTNAISGTVNAIVKWSCK